MKRLAPPAAVSMVLLTLAAWNLAPIDAHADEAGPGSSTNISCGAVLTTSLTLARDMICPGTVFITGNSPTPVVVDLSGHTISSPESAQSTVAALPGLTMTLEDGTVVGPGITEDGAGPNTYRDLTFVGGGFRSFDNSSPNIVGSRFLQGAGIRAKESAPTITGNIFTDGPSSATAIDLELAYASVFGNTVLGYGTGISITDNGEAQVVRNAIFRSGTGIVIGAGAPLPGDVSGNLVANGSSDGILVETGAGQTSGLTLDGNVLLHNGGDGLRIDPTLPEHFPQLGMNLTVTANRAIGNAAYGISSPGSVPSDSVVITDGGGNVARLNVKAPQCLNISCRVG